MFPHIIAIGLSVMALLSADLVAAVVEPIGFGDMNDWSERKITESVILGGHQQRIYYIGPHKSGGTDSGSGSLRSPWATNNVSAHIMGASKASNAVFPVKRMADDSCAKLCSRIERAKLLGLFNLDVMLAGSIFLGDIDEPVSDIRAINRHMDMGIPFARRPNALVLDFMADVPLDDYRQQATGFGARKTFEGQDSAVVMVMLQRRWEDASGAIHAVRIGTGGEKISHTCHWQNDYRVGIKYGDCSKTEGMDWLGLRTGDEAFYARNSQGQMVPVNEEGWGGQHDVPTHLIVLISAAGGDRCVATEGLTLYVDNIGLEY